MTENPNQDQDQGWENVHAERSPFWFKAEKGAEVQGILLGRFDVENDAVLGRGCAMGDERQQQGCQGGRCQEAGLGDPSWVHKG